MIFRKIVGPCTKPPGPNLLKEPSRAKGLASDELPYQEPVCYKYFMNYILYGNGKAYNDAKVIMTFCLYIHNFKKTA